MLLAPGTRLGPYEIMALIGTGGMGEVFKARDTRLDRFVAIKVSKEQFSERFDREARSIAALNHPNICQIHDVGPNYLVMEYIEGKSLEGPVPSEEALRLAGQIADALHAAHLKGIVHRDLKPTNILVTKGGVKLLDFGLAKFQAQPAAGGNTATMGITKDNAILGTLQYMSPEQLQGKAVDARSDIFSFGVVLYEMITGKRAFEASNQASLIAAILERDAPVLEPEGLNRVVRACLAKDPDERFQSARDVKRAIEWGVPDVAKSSISSNRWRALVAWMLAAAVCLCGLLFLGVLLSRTRSNGEVTRFAIYPPAGTTFGGSENATVSIPQFALSPDGRSIVFVSAYPRAKPMLWLRSLDEVGPRPLAGTESASFPFWSPDSSWIGFFAEGKFKKILAVGGPAQVVSGAVGNAFGGSWGSNETILFAPGTGLNLVPAAGGPISPVTTPDTSRLEGGHRWPHFLPDGHHFLYNIRGALEQRGVYAGSLDRKTKKFLMHLNWNAVYAPPNYLLYLNGNTLMAQAFDAGTLQISGQPFSIAEGVGGASNGLQAVSVSRTGALAYTSAMLDIGQLTWFDRSGKILEAVGPIGDYTDFRLSPDEKRLAMSLVDSKVSTPDIWLADLARGGSLTRFTSDPLLDASAVWSPDGARIMFRTNRKGNISFFEKSAGGAGNEEQFSSESGFNLVPSDWSPDGQHILYSKRTSSSGFNLWLLAVTGDKKPVAFLVSSADEMHGNFSPDGRFVAYSSDDSGKFEVYVQTFPRTDRRWKISTNGGYEPRWRHDGRELYYLSEDRKLIAVQVSGTPEFEVGAPKALFQTRVPEGVNPQRTNYVPSRDGQRFLLKTQSGEPGPRSITVVLNWTAGLKR
jgi:Tol biopolymer transport system component/predicted Ser/Thr protein kinase